MTPAAQLFTAMRPEPPLRGIYRRLGHRIGATQISEDQDRAIRRAMDEALALIDLKGAARTLAITEHGEGHVRLADGTTFASEGLARMLKDAQAVLLMAATAGEAIMQAIQADMAGRDMTRGVILDATASEVVDAGLDWIMAYFRNTLLRQGLTLSHRRFSAGYGDFDLGYQRAMYRLLGLERIGVGITESCILVPEKSVSAVAGILGGQA